MTRRTFVPGRGMNDHECYHMVENLKQRFKPPYSIAGYAPINVQSFEKELKAVPEELSSKETQTIDELIKLFREFKPEGEWIIFAKGQYSGYKNPGAFISTTAIAKAKRHRERMGN